ncbi:hypothetical protein N7540_000702 [Penicillium herquei]|nr:hypothetical protein N7540_000702 [Penicillium herquei]
MRGIEEMRQLNGFTIEIRGAVARSVGSVGGENNFIRGGGEAGSRPQGEFSRAAHVSQGLEKLQLGYLPLPPLRELRMVETNFGSIGENSGELGNM